ncbi:Histidine biosynthesis protein [Rhizoctonia solani]|uniref:Histidine biosynthesis protein n=1 Tax=Rhizoctonia solani TaxID=456999 RepID=A0A8H8NMC0_9AGAM|nr:Histidine biosynthesis protein [Rhizoctonia solani]QRW16339.1 Histidine biosynthesis protein [Rhizoctonia solani]
MSRSRRSSPTHRSVFRPCIDLHDGHVKQIVGGTLSNNPEELRTNFVATDSAASFARLYRMNQLEGGHVVKLGPGNDSAAKEALAAWRGGLQIGGGITEANAQEWLDAGASKVNFTPFRADRTLILSPPVQQIIVTSYLFPNARFSLPRLQSLCRLVGRERLVVDVRKSGDKWVVAMNKWQDLTDMEVNKASLDLLSKYCSEFLIHAADVEGLCQGIDEALVTRLGEWSTIPVTYAGGARDISDLDLVERLSHGRVDLTFGSSLDIFGGTQVSFAELVEYNNSRLNE